MGRALSTVKTVRKRQKRALAPSEMRSGPCLRPHFQPSSVQCFGEADKNRTHACLRVALLPTAPYQSAKPRLRNSARTC